MGYSRSPFSRSSGVFPEGLQKLLFPEILGAGRFARIGIPYADVMGPFVGVVETVCSLLIIVGLFTRLATIPLLIVMVVAVVSTSAIFAKNWSCGASGSMSRATSIWLRSVNSCLAPPQVRSVSRSGFCEARVF